MQLNGITFFHILELERILGFLDPSFSNKADKEKFAKIAKNFLKKICSAELINEIIDHLKEGKNISNAKFSELIDSYKFTHKFPVIKDKNNSDNYKKKMLIHELSI